MFGNLPKRAQNDWPLKVSTCVQRVCVAENASAGNGIFSAHLQFGATIALLSRLLDPSFTLHESVCAEAHTTRSEETLRHLKHTGFSRFTEVLQ